MLDSIACGFASEDDDENENSSIVSITNRSRCSLLLDSFQS